MIAKKQLRVGGMTCVNCQNRIQKALRGTAGVVSAQVSYRDGTAQVSYETDRITEAEIRAVIEKQGYHVLPDGKGSGIGVLHTAGLLALILCAYVLLEHFGILNLLVPSQLAQSTMGYGMLFVIGLITSVHCIAMCGGINLSQCIPRTETPEEGEGGRFSTFLPSVLYNLGRVISYTFIGFVLGFLGMLLGGGGTVGVSGVLQGILKMLAGILMVIMGVNMLGLVPGLRRLTPHMPKWLATRSQSWRAGAQRVKHGRSFFVGLLNGLMPCGPLQSMQIVALASGNPFAGALSMLLFSLGTVPLMLGLGSLVSALGKRFTRIVTRVGAVLVVVLGLAMLAQGGSLSGLIQPGKLLAIILLLSVLCVTAALPIKKSAVRGTVLAVVLCVGLITLAAWSHLSNPSQPADGPDAGEQIVVEDGVQVVNSTLSSGQYPDITVQAGLPVKWIIQAPEGSINGCNYKFLIQEYGIEYTFQEGENSIEFTPTETGIVEYSCWMGMIRGRITVVDGPDVPAPADAAGSDGEETDAALSAIPGRSYCG